MSDWFPETVIGPNDCNKFYSLDSFKEKFEVREICYDGWVALNWPEDKDSNWLKFAVLDFAGSNVDRSNIIVDVEFYGEGPVGSLRECRHTYWGEEGYIFYPNGPLIIAAFKALSEFYQGLKESE